eukprot:CAMPEP_0183738034 /NCGR_PEP_ID=MMETSP0737-20130205/53674_1 /TAXON_ID=385413 /ORGANISM="Thalassiosira miniscula, Strain CCMP1093" /LENGTH=414 /DNA_ID=CAMNT_0025972481 /DNA_START=92 /DNA_END=1336 /DNA_ORIENTATION=+
MAPSPQIQMLRHTARIGLSQSRARRAATPSVHLTHQHHDVHQQATHRHNQRRHLHNTPTPRAQPNKYVTGVTPEQLAESKAMQDWYDANFKDWQDEPDKIIVGENDQDEKEKAAEEEEEEEQKHPSSITLPEHLTKRNIRPLVAYLRQPGIEEGTRNCNKLRNPGVNDPYFPLIPGILHGSDPTQNIASNDPSSKIILKTPWFEIQRELDRYHHGLNGSFENRVYALTVFPSEEACLDHHTKWPPKDATTYHIDDETTEMIATPGAPPPVPPSRTPVPGMENILVLPADLQMHPVANAPFCLNFLRYHANKPIKIPIRTINEEESNTLKRGGFLAPVNRFIECLVEDGAPIPEYIALECTGLRQKDVVRRDRLIIPEGVKVHPRVPEDYLMGTVFGVRGGGAAVLEGEEGEEAN